LSNAFDRENYPTKEPSTLVLGDFWAWKRDDLAEIYPIASYSLTFEFHEDSGGGGIHKFTLTAVEANSTYYIEAASSSTTGYSVGDYIWEAYITKTSDSNRIMVDSGRTSITENLANTNADLRSHAKKVVDAIEAVIENRASMDQSSMSIAGRSLSRMSIDELMTFRDRYKAEYLKEIKLARIRNGQGTGNTPKVRFTK
tara:strand:- start:1127 stop:1723 length:597 start_codon:yes stop_codon:yes gene_type:complete